MKVLIQLVLVYFFFLSKIFSQNSSSMVFYIVDEFSNIPVENCRVEIKEIGFESKISGIDGKVYFEDLPNGEINYSIVNANHENVYGVFNITSESKSNTLKVELSQTKFSNLGYPYFVEGRILDINDESLSKIKVKCNFGRNNQVLFSNDLGYFSFKFEFKNINDVPKQINIIAGNTNYCKNAKTFNIGENRYNFVRENIKLNCGRNGLPHKLNFNIDSSKTESIQLIYNSVKYNLNDTFLVSLNENVGVLKRAIEANYSIVRNDLNLRNKNVRNYKGKLLANFKSIEDDQSIREAGLRDFDLIHYEKELTIQTIDARPPINFKMVELEVVLKGGDFGSPRLFNLGNNKVEGRIIYKEKGLIKFKFLIKYYSEISYRFKFIDGNVSKEFQEKDFIKTEKNNNSIKLEITL